MEVRKGKQAHYPFPLINLLRKYLLLGVLAFISLFVYQQIDWSQYLPIKTVRVYGINRVERQAVQKIVMPLVNHGFFTTNVEYIRDRLLQMPWVADIFVQRAWPDRVDITIIEKKAIAKWNEQGLLSTTGELFSPTIASYPNDLPHFIGPAGQQIKILQSYQDINHVLMPLHAKIMQLTLLPDAAWKVTLDNGMTLQIGHKDSLTRLGHFVKVYAKIVGTRSKEIDYIDLRYANGMAVRWKS